MTRHARIARLLAVAILGGLAAGCSSGTQPLRIGAVFPLTGPLASLAQDPPKDDEKKEDTKDKDKKEEGLPLKTDKKIEFTTDEGTWMSLDVSSDGKTIVFDLLGDIYTVPTSGGEAKRIIGGLSFESQPELAAMTCT